MVLTLPQAGIAQPLDNLETSVFDIKYGAEDFEFNFGFSNPWSRVLGTSFSKIFIMPQIFKLVMALPIE